ncbi:MAG: hypothetical protein U0R17_04025 [Acidimicrobiia bacterium]
MLNSRKSRALLLGVAAGVLPISTACSSDKADDSAPSISVEITATPLDTVVPVSAECGVWREEYDSPDSFSSEHILIENDRNNFYNISNKRMPKEILYSKDSSGTFIDLLSTLKTSIAPIIVPPGVQGSAIITYPGIREGETASYRLSIDAKGNITLANDTNELSAVSLQSKRNGKHNEVYVGSVGDHFRVLQSGSSWIGELGQLPKLDDSSDQGFKVESSNTSNAQSPFLYLNKPVTKPDEQYGAIAFSPELQTACNVLVGLGNATNELGGR